MLGGGDIRTRGNMNRSRDNGRAELLGDAAARRGEDVRVEMADEDRGVGINDHQLQVLGEKVATIKNLSSAIHNDVQEQLSFLDEMQLRLGQTTDSLRATTSKLQDLINEGGGNMPLCYLVLFITFIFLVLYYLTKSK
mmetsp:Transcript_1431/g.3842  ORF Transcript_1431/g.3842 Transcript_1431/m.3842 type:complete len:138 (+) Transcript_1431:204-617(+)